MKSRSNRRAFLKQAGALTALSSFVNQPLGSMAFPSTAAAEQTAAETPEQLGWKPHWIKQGDGKGGWLCRPAQMQFLHAGDGKMSYMDRRFPGFVPFGVVQMDNGELVLVGVKRDETSAKPVEKTAVTFSKDLGATWEPIRLIEDALGRPMELTFLGRGKLVFQIDGQVPAMQYFSSDYGRTWADRQPLQVATSGVWEGAEGFYAAEGNPLVRYELEACAR